MGYQQIYVNQSKKIPKILVCLLNNIKTSQNLGYVYQSQLHHSNYKQEHLSRL